MQKEKRTDNKAVLEVAGRDQQDHKLRQSGQEQRQSLWKYYRWKCSRTHYHEK